MIALRPSLALLIPTLDQIGGAERQVLLLAQSLAKLGWHVTVITLSGTANAETAQLTHLGIDYFSLEMRRAWVDPQGWRRYIAWHRQNQPAIIHAHLPHATWFARCVRPFAPVRVVIDTIHTSNTGTLARKLLYRLTRPLTTHVTCVSDAVAQTTLAAKMANQNKLSVLPNGVPLPKLSDERKQQRSFHWVAIGRLSPVKDYPTLLQAFALLPQGASLTIAGTGPEEATLRKLAATLDIAARVHFAGFQPNIQPLLQSADAFVLSSRWEGLPISVLEASAASLPVVATDGAGTGEALISEQTGLLVPVGNPEALASAMVKIMELPTAESQKMGSNGRRFIEENFSLPAVTARWESLYLRLLATHSDPAAFG